MDDVQPFELFVYGIDDSIAAAAGATQTGKLASQRTANSQRLFGQWTEDDTKQAAPIFSGRRSGSRSARAEMRTAKAEVTERQGEH